MCIRGQEQMQLLSCKKVATMLHMEGITLTSLSDNGPVRQTMVLTKHKVKQSLILIKLQEEMTV